MTKDIERVKQFVILGFDDCSIDFKTREMNSKAILEIVKLVKLYNEFNGEKVAKAIEKINEVWNNSYQLGYSFGREGSCVLYIHLPYWKTEIEKYTEEERQERIDKSLSILKEVKPDELWNTDKSTIRAWWD